MAINNIVPRVDGEGKLGIQNKKWNEVNALNINSSTITSTKVRTSDLLTVNDQDLISAGSNIEILKNAQGQYEISSNALSSIPTASTIQSGVIEIATDAEAASGTLTDVAVTPKQLKDNLKKSSGTNSEIQITDNLGGFSSSSLYQDSNGNILPQSDNVTNIGSQSQKVKQIFLSSNTSQGFDGTYDSLVNKPNFAGGINYKSTYDAATNTPDLTLIDNEVGDLYKVSVAGSIGSISLLAGDHIIFNSNVTTSTLSDLEAHIDKIDNTETVTSVNNKVGAVDIGFFDLSDTSGTTPIDGNYVVAVTGSTLSLQSYSTNTLANWQEDTNGDLIPTTTSTYSIGNANFRVKDLYLTNNSLNFENGSLSVTGGTISFANNDLAKYSDIKHNFADLDDINITGQYGLLTYNNGSIDLSVNDEYVIDSQVYNGSTTYHFVPAPTSKSYIKITKEGAQWSSSETSARRLLFPDPDSSFAGTIVKLKGSSTTGSGWIGMSANNLLSYVDSVPTITPSVGVYRSKYVKVDVGTVHTYICTSTHWILIEVERNETGDSYNFNNGNLTLTSGSLYLDGTKLLTANDALSTTSFYTTTINATSTASQITDVRRQHYNVITGGVTLTIPSASGATGGIISIRNNSTSSINVAFSGVTYELANGTVSNTTITIKSNATRTFTWISDTVLNEIEATSLEYMSDISITSPVSGQVLKYDGTNWINDTDNTGATSSYLPGLSDDQIHTITLGTGVDTATGSIATQYDLVPGLTNSGSLGTIDKRFAEVNSNNINVVGLNTFVEPGVYTFSTEGGSESILGITSNRGASVLKLNTLSGSLSLSTETALNSPFTADVMIDLPYELNSEIANLTIPVTTSTSPMTYKFEKVEQSLVDGSVFYKVKSAFMLDENIESFTDTTKNEATPAIASVPCKTYIFISRIADTLKTVNLGAPERIGQKFIIKNLSTSTNEISLQPTAGITFDDGQITSIAAQNNDALTLIADTMTNWILV